MEIDIIKDSAHLQTPPNSHICYKSTPLSLSVPITRQGHFLQKGPMHSEVASHAMYFSTLISKHPG